MHKVALVAAALVAATGAASARAQMIDRDAAMFICNSDVGTFAPELLIDGCTAIIQNRWVDQQMALIFLRRGDAYRAQGDQVRAIADYDRAIQINPQDANAVTRRGNAYFEQRDYARALADYEQAIQLNPSSSLGHHNRGLVNHELGEHARAIADFDQAALLDPQNVSHENARCWSRAAANLEFEVARAACERARRMAPRAAEPLNNRGLLGLKQQRWQEAWNDYNTAIRRNADRADYYFGRGVAALRLGRAAQGQADIARATQLDADIAQTYAGYGVTP